MQNIFLNISTFGKLLKKGHSPTLEKSEPQYGFSEYIERTIEAHKQKYRLFACFFSWKKNGFKFFFSKRNCTPCPVGTKSEKGERSRNSYQLAPFQGWKGGEQ